MEQGTAKHLVKYIFVYLCRYQQSRRVKRRRIIYERDCTNLTTLTYTNIASLTIGMQGS